MQVEQLKTPCYVIDEDRLEENFLHQVIEATDCKILLAQKAYSSYATYPLIAKYLNGTTASGLFEAKLGKEMMPEGKETHVFSAAYRQDEFEEIAQICDHIVFNSFYQLEKFRWIAQKYGRGIGLRVNPECSTQEGHAIYDPCSPGSRLGITIDEFSKNDLVGVEGIHFHTL